MREEWREMHDISLVAANSQADQALTALNFSHSTLKELDEAIGEGIGGTV